VRRDFNHSFLRGWRLLLLFREGKRSRDEVRSVLLDMLVKYDLVHCLCEFKVDLTEKSGSV
jgi:hypothetical protein